MSEFDSPWKEALERYFMWFMALFFPAVYADIDWSRGYEMLDKELQAVVREGEAGRRTVDKLFKVWRRSGEEQWVLVHVEVQSQEVPGFAEQMFEDHHRLRDRFGRPVASFAVLGDARATWRPDHFGYTLWGTSLEFRFSAVKLLDFDEAALEQNPNPFATVVLAHRKSMETSGDPESRRFWKVRLVKGLYHRGWSSEEVRQLFRLIDGFIELPTDLEQQAWQEVQDYQKETQMPYIGSMQRMWRDQGLAAGREEGRAIGVQEGREEGRAIGVQEGREEGREEGRAAAWDEAIELMLMARFSESAAELMQEIRQLPDLEVRRKIARAIPTATTVDEVRRIWKA